jgi:hypothetical protein
MMYDIMKHFSLLTFLSLLSISIPSSHTHTHTRIIKKLEELILEIINRQFFFNSMMMNDDRLACPSVFIFISHLQG